jgi:hypothetical protein
MLQSGYWTAAKPDTTTVTLVVKKYWREQESHRHRMHGPFCDIAIPHRRRKIGPVGRHGASAMKEAA